MRTYIEAPPIVSGYPLNDIWEVVVPIARTNEITNPSGETNTTNYTAGAGTLTRSTEQQYYGAYSFKYVPSVATTDGFYYGTITTVTAQFRAIHCKFRGQANLPYALTLATTGGVDLVVKPFIATGRWQWVILYYNESAGASRRIYFRKNGNTNVYPFYVDGVQSEVISAGELASTYIDGDQAGLVPNQSPPAYYWNGTPHASTSTRSGQTRAGGMVIPFKRYGFQLLAMIGLALAEPQNVATSYARIDGSYDDYTRKPARQFTLTGRFDGATDLELRRNRSALGQYFDRDVTGQDQRLVLLHHLVDDCDTPIGDTCRFLVKYQSGFGGDVNNFNSNTIPITFTQYLPNILADGESGSALDVQDSVANADYFVKRSPAGVWSVPGGGTGGVTNLLEGLDGTIYIAGSFANWNGNASSDNIVKYNPITGVYTPLSTGTNGSVSAMANLPDGRIVIGGAFTLAGGVANTVRIAVYNPTTDLFTALGTGASTNNVLSLAVDATGNIYAGGDYALMGGVANTVRLAYWNGSAWTALGTGANGTVNAIAVGRDGYVYLTGSFTTLNGVACNQIGRYKVSTTTFSAMSTGVNGSGGRALAIGPNNIVYIGGLFTAAGGLSGTNRVASWNGVQFQSMGGGLGDDVNGLSVDLQGTILATGQFGQTTSDGGTYFPDGSARWSGSSWTTIGIDVPATNTIGAGLITHDGTLYLAYGVTGTATTEGTVTITNPGTARSYPTVTIKGPSSGTSRIYSMINYTTNRAIYFNLTLNAGETATLVFQPDDLSFTSDFQGNIAGTILPGSNEADFFLQRGANTISVFSANSTVVATLHYRPTYTSLDDVP